MTTHLATLSSKYQITIPVDILQKLGWKGGQKFSLFLEGNSLIIKSYKDNILTDIHKLTNSYNLPKIKVEEALNQTRSQNQSQKYKYEN